MINIYQMSDVQLITLLHDPRIMALLIILAIWDLSWRGSALWKASRNKSMPWFIALLILNTIGILPIVYIFFFAQKENNNH
jgi:hypothetical protein